MQPFTEGLKLTPDREIVMSSDQAMFFRAESASTRGKVSIAESKA